MLDIIVIPKSSVSVGVTILCLVVANVEFWAAQILIGHVLLKERLFVIFKDLQALQIKQRD